MARSKDNRTEGAGGDAAAPESGLQARLFEADRDDRRLDRDELRKVRPSDRQLLWIDAPGGLPEDDLAWLATRFELRPRTRAQLASDARQPLVALHGDYLHVRIAAEPSDDDAGRTRWLDVVAAPNVVITHHDRPIGFLSDIDERIERDAPGGTLTSTALFAAILDAALTSYHAAVDAIEDDVDRLDAESLRGEGRDELLEELVRERRRIARLRRLLADHRRVFTALASPEIGRLADDPDAATFLQGIASRFDTVMAAVEASREALLGSFDVFMSRTAQRTNDVMKVLTIATVLLLPGSLLAGLLGMNVDVPLPKEGLTSFWSVVLAIGALAAVILVAARWRRWL